MKKKLWFFIHDVIAHPICGIFWIIGLNTFSDWLHDWTVNEVNYGDETWSPEDKRRKNKEGKTYGSANFVDTSKLPHSQR